MRTYTIKHIKCKIDFCEGLGKLNPNTGKVCFIKGYCNKHYLRLRRGQEIVADSRYDSRPAKIYGDYAYIPIYTKNGYIEAIVGSQDSWVEKYKWRLNKGYPVAWVNGETVALHLLINGKPPKGKVTDHKDRNRLNNTKSNLRFITPYENLLNSRMRKHNKSGYRGVSYYNEKKMWCAEIRSQGKRHFLGYFKNKKEAAKAYNSKAIILHGEFAILNEIECST